MKTTTRIAVGVLALLMAATASTGCCGSLEADRGKLDLPTVGKALDSKHAEIAAGGQGRLWAGAALVDITPADAYGKGIYLGGFDMGRKSKGVRDPVYAHILYLDDGREPFVLVTLDTIGLMNPAVKDIRALATNLHGSRIVIATTHNHVGPDTIGYWGPAVGGFLPICTGRCPNYMETMKHQVAAGIDQAVLSAKPARLRFGQGQADPALSINIHPQIRDEKNDTVRVMAVEDEAGGPIALVANWGCHVEALWNDELLSSDWPAIFYERVRKEWGGVPIFIEGALGGLVTTDPGPEKMAMEKEIMDVFIKHMTTDERVALMHKVGNSFTDTVFQILKGSGEPVGPDAVSIRSVNQGLDLNVNNWIFEYMGNRRLIDRQVTTRNRKMFMSTDLTVMRIQSGDRIVAEFTSIPGEPAPPFVSLLDQGAGTPMHFTVALGNDEIGYIVREEDWELPQYEYERTMSLGRETGTRILEVVSSLRESL